jgi:hypothetical protein
MASVLETLQALVPGATGDGFNPDGITMEPDRMERIGRVLFHHPAISAQYLFAHVAGVAEIDADAMCTLGCYCANKAMAMRERLTGSIQKALLYEGECETLYHELPKAIRW